MTEIRLVTAKQAPQEKTELFEGANQRVLLQGFHVEDCADTEAQLNAFQHSEAPDKLLLIDAYSRLFVGDAIKPWKGDWWQKRKRLLRRMQTVRDSGGVARFIHEDMLLRVPPLYGGRSHIKIALADDELIAGGIDTNSMSPSSIDASLRVRSKSVADQVFHHAQLLASLGHNRGASRTITVDESTVFLIDGGTKGESAIYERACELAASSDTTEITHYSQYIPNSRLLKLYAKSGKPVTICTNDPRSLVRPYRYEQISLEKRARNVGNVCLEFVGVGLYMHAKVVIYKQKDGSKIMILGSHNLQGKDVGYGTAECAFITHDQDTIQEVEAYFKEMLDT